MTIFDPPPKINCPLCSGNGYTIFQRGEISQARICSCVSLCKRCHGYGVVSVTQGGVQRSARCRCQKLPDRIQIFNLANIPAIHGNSSFATFQHLDGPSSRAMKVCSLWIDAIETEEPNRGIVLSGNVGRGKTHLLVSLMKALIFRFGKRTRFIEFSRLLSRLRSAYSKGVGEEAILDDLIRVPILAIDELGKGRLNDWEQSVIDDIISRRYNSMKPIIATSNFRWGIVTGNRESNLSDPDFKKQSIADRIGSRAFSRLQEMCAHVEVSGDDYRKRNVQSFS